MDKPDITSPGDPSEPFSIRSILLALSIVGAWIGACALLDGVTNQPNRNDHVHSIDAPE